MIENTHKMKRLLKAFLLLTITSSLVLTGCNEDDSSRPIPSFDGFSPSIGQAGTLVTVSGENLNSLPSDLTISFNGVESTISTITADEITTRVPADSETGDLVISYEDVSLTLGEFTYLLSEITLNKNALVLDVGEYDTLRITTELNGRQVSWETSAPEVVSIDDNGRINALDNGSATLTATVDGVSASCLVTVNLTLEADDFTETVQENRLQGSDIGIISTNADHQDASFSILEQTPAGAIQVADNGTIQVADPSLFDFELHEEITGRILIVAGGSQQTINFIITITNIPEGTIEDFETSIDEYPEVGDVIWTIASEDKSGTITFSIPSQSIAGAVGINGEGIITVSDASAFQYDINTEITGIVSCTEDGNTVTANFTININNLLEVSTFAGISGSGYLDGPRADAKFDSPNGIVQDSNGNFFICDEFNHVIRKIDPNGTVTTFAGRVQGFEDGPGSSALFDRPGGLAIDASNNLYVSDIANGKIRKITPSGVVTTLNGNFFLPNKPAVDLNGNVYVTEGFGNQISKIDPTGNVTTVAGSGATGNADGSALQATFNHPRAITADGSGNLFVADMQNHSIRKISSTGQVSTIAGSSKGYADGTGTNAMFDFPTDIQIVEDRYLYVNDSRNDRVRLIDLTDNSVTTFAGRDGVGSYRDGTLDVAAFVGLESLFVTSSEEVYVTDGPHRIRLIK